LSDALSNALSKALSNAFTLSELCFEQAKF
jgi:hypothetical protein